MSEILFILGAGSLKEVGASLMFGTLYKKVNPGLPFIYGPSNPDSFHILLFFSFLLAAKVIYI